MTATLVSAVAESDAKLVATRRGDRLVCQFRTINGEDAEIWKPVEDEAFATIRRNQSVKLVKDSKGWNLIDPSTVVEPPTIAAPQLGTVTPDDLFVSLLDAIHQQTATLQQILAQMNAPKLGLHDAAGGMKIYCNRSNGCLWYRLQDGQPVPIQQTALTGYLVNLEFSKVERRGKECCKLLMTIQGDRPYLLEAGHDSHFSKGLLCAVASMPPTVLQRPITLSPQPGEDDSVLFCRVFSGGELIRTSYDDSTDWRSCAQAAIAAVRAAVNKAFPNPC
jgi:hypothetical protein